MVTVSGNSIIDGFTYGVPLKQIYTYGNLVWDRYSENYISWTPVNLNQSFSINGITYQMSQFSGYFTGFNGIITRAAFYQTSLTTLETNAFSIDVNAFGECSLLTSVNLSKCSYIIGGFDSCKNLIYVSAPKCKLIGSKDSVVGQLGGFNSCSKLTSIFLPECESIIGGFRWCNHLSYISLPKCTYIEHGFESCIISSIELPECLRLGPYAFVDCSSLIFISLPKCKYIDFDAFGWCRNLSEIFLPECSYLGEGAFEACTNLSEIYLGYSSVCYLSNSVFWATPIDSGSGSIYVPQSLVEDYKSDSIWSNYASQIFPIPE